MRIRRIRFTLLLLALGFSLLTSAPALSMKPIVEQQIVPDFDDGDAAATGGSHGHEGTGREIKGKVPDGTDASDFSFWSLSNLRDLLRSMSLAIWKADSLH